ncbi:MAG: deoxyribodipyrimidine photolyase, partial [Paracoccaceae bacterium]
DVMQAARDARDRVWSVRKGSAFRDTARKVIDKHASRKDASGHFVDDRAKARAPRKTPPKDTRQMGFDF